MAASLREVEAAIIAALRDALPELSVESFPDNPEEYDFIHPLGAVLVQYDGSSFGGSRVSCGAIAQVRTLRFTAVLLLRSLRGDSVSAGCYAILDRASGVLNGLHVSGAVGGGRIVSEEFASEADGIWMYTQTYEFAVRSVAEWHL